MIILFVKLLVIGTVVITSQVLASVTINEDFEEPLRVLATRLTESKVKTANRIVNRLPKSERRHFIEQVLKLNQRSPEGSVGLETLDILCKTQFHEREDAVNQYLRLMDADSTASKPLAKSFQIITKLQTDHRSLFVDKVLQLTRPTMTLVQQFTIMSVLHNVLSPERDEFIAQTLRLVTPDDTNYVEVLNIIQALARLDSLVRAPFVDSILNSGTTDANQRLDLIRTSIESWIDTMRGFREVLDEMQGEYGNQNIFGLRNQTVHDKAYESSIDEAVVKLSARYSRFAQDLETLLCAHLEKIEDLESKKLLSETEAQVVRYFFSSGIERLSADRHGKVTQYLNLSWHALGDKAVSKSFGLEAAFNDKDVDDRIAGWLRAGPMDAQLAYLLDNLGGRFKTKCILLEAVSKEDALMTAGESCIGGSYNRLIDGLNCIDPDVVLAVGEGNKKNIELMARTQFLRNQAVKFLAQRYEEEPDLFSTLDVLKQKTSQYLLDSLKTEVGTTYPDVTMAMVEQEIGCYFEGYFEEDLNKVTPLRSVQDYVNNWEEGLLRDLQTWIEANPSLSFEMILSGAKEQTTILLNSKLAALKGSIPERSKRDLIDHSITIAKMKVSRHYTGVFQTIASAVLDQVPTGPTSSFAMKYLVDLVLKELRKSQADPEQYRTAIASAIRGDEKLNAAVNAKVV
ncbi:hypothetical protein [Candidatus Finniella inopinata]|uniref:Uncharacterized protein n=1 Tax=Candidatus Finniella inopinata TaxID=1696036 RepID=A0A4Q7DJJ8_9PROT|nr:hypothetical protein [Candidatus Finniella inopinata]RZI46214.1 hypothetical protein EQU50_04565 [Candidatus Finniella inopinata]